MNANSSLLMPRSLSVVGIAGVALLSLAGSPAALRAQNETLFHGGASSLGFYAAPVVKLTEIGGQGEVLAGARFGLLFSRQFAVGLAAYGGGHPRGYLDGPIPLPNGIHGLDGDYGRGGSGRTIGYGGVEFEYVAMPAKLVHASISTLLGAGWFGNNQDLPILVGSGPMRGYGDRGNTFFVAEPAANAEVNLAKHVRLALGVGYRFAAGDHTTSFQSPGGVTGSLGLKLGKM
ncbi:MAG: hypothetical protein U0132_19675 [Gemmatimonadaceae bacterium]